MIFAISDDLLLLLVLFFVISDDGKSVSILNFGFGLYYLIWMFIYTQ